jgi:predicted AAA+ superfamily ATPase
VTYRRRHVEQVIAEALLDTRVVIVNGARQAGKSTAVHRLVRDRPGVRERQLDRPNDLNAARLDPAAFVEHDGLLVIDEVQRAPELILPIKYRVDADNRPGQYLLTGSARLLGLRTLPDALVGRSETVELWPFAQGEIDGAPDRFVDAIFSPLAELSTSASLDRADYIERIVRGGFPEAVERVGRRRARFFESYARDIIDRDVTQLGEIQRRDDLARLLSILADRAASPLSIDGVANGLAISKNTVERYLALFEEVFLVKRIPAWTNSATTRATRQRKLVFVDSGMCAHLAGFGAERLRRDPVRGGSLIESFVLSEIMRQLAWSDAFARLYHYRTRDGEEVDAVIEHHDGRIVGIEVKASSSVSGDDLRHLRHLRDKAGDSFHRGVLLYTGTEVLPLGDRLIAAPIDSLWHSG